MGRCARRTSRRGPPPRRRARALPPRRAALRRPPSPFPCLKSVAPGGRGAVGSAVAECTCDEPFLALTCDEVGGCARPAGHDLAQLRADVMERDAVVGGDSRREAAVDELAVARPPHRLAV